MVIDTSAIIAILFDEHESALFQKYLLSASQRYMSTASALEIYAVMLKRKGQASLSRVKEFFRVAKIELIAFDDEQLDLAKEAFVRFGKGQHPAGLNFGDCFSYALAKSYQMPLLCKGNDFVKTDLTCITPNHSQIT